MPHRHPKERCGASRQGWGSGICGSGEGKRKVRTAGGGGDGASWGALDHLSLFAIKPHCPSQQIELVLSRRTLLCVCVCAALGSNLEQITPSSSAGLKYTPTAFPFGQHTWLRMLCKRTRPNFSPLLVKATETVHSIFTYLRFSIHASYTSNERVVTLGRWMDGGDKTYL